MSFSRMENIHVASKSSESSKNLVLKYSCSARFMCAADSEAAHLDSTGMLSPRTDRPRARSLDS